MGIHDSLIIKYGLEKSPEDSQIAEWVSLTEHFSPFYATREMAGEQAAIQVFSDYKKKAYSFDADKIEILLAVAKNRRDSLCQR